MTGQDDNGRRGRGRPTECRKSKRLEIRLTPEQRTEWSRKAEAAGFGSVADWIRELADRENP